jgi:hypothetical protein
VVQFEIHSALANLACLCQALGMAEKRTKLEKSQRQADQLEKRADTRPEQTPKKRTPRENMNEAAPRIARKISE